MLETLKFYAVRFLGISAILLTAANPCSAADGNSKVTFDRPAEYYTESCPLGNGRLGAMVFGQPVNEKIVLNETGMWSGSVQKADRDDAVKHLPQLRKLLLEGKNAQAEELAETTFTSVPQVPVKPSVRIKVPVP